MPFCIARGSAELVLARTATSWRVTLINNLGVTKTCTWDTVWPNGGCTDDMIDTSAEQTVELVWNGPERELSVSATELVTTSLLSIAANGSIMVTVPAGEVRVLDLFF